MAQIPAARNGVTGQVKGDRTMYQIYRIKQEEKVLKQNVIRQEDGTDLEYLTFPLLEKTGIVEHLVTTRFGGVSTGEFSSMNLSFTRGDNHEAVRTNYERVANVLGCSMGDMVASHQTHTTNIRKITVQDKGKGILCPRDYENVDGLVTNEPGIALVTYYADCVPLFFVDVEHKAIGLAHSGWRGTVGRMGECMVKAMEQCFGSKPEKLYVAIGPSICQECYEVSEDVAMQFIDMLGNEVAVPGKQPGKYQLDLWLSNEKILQRAGVLPQHIAVTDICTCHNSDYLFSHRVNGDKRGNFGAFLMLKQEG